MLPDGSPPEAVQMVLPHTTPAGFALAAVHAWLLVRRGLQRRHFEIGAVIAIIVPAHAQWSRYYRGVRIATRNPQDKFTRPGAERELKAPEDNWPRCSCPDYFEPTGLSLRSLTEGLSPTWGSQFFSVWSGQQKKMERETGVEPATSSLGSWHSTTGIDMRPSGS